MHLRAAAPSPIGPADLLWMPYRQGTRLSSALIRVAVRRLLDNPGDLAGDLKIVAPVHDL